MQWNVAVLGDGIWRKETARMLTRKNIDTNRHTEKHPAMTDWVKNISGKRRTEPPAEHVWFVKNTKII